MVGTIFGAPKTVMFCGQSCYERKLIIQRRSGDVDRVPVLLQSEVEEGERVWLSGYVVSANDTTRHLHHFVCATHFAERYEGKDENEVELIGYICNAPIYRRTPNGREITEIFLAAQRGEGDASYIPCIAWGKVARRARKLHTGDCIRLIGRLQSRKYTKGNCEREINEVSITTFEKEGV